MLHLQAVSIWHCLQVQGFHNFVQSWCCNCKLFLSSSKFVFFHGVMKDSVGLLIESLCYHSKKAIFRLSIRLEQRIQPPTIDLGETILSEHNADKPISIENVDIIDVNESNNEAQIRIQTVIQWIWFLRRKKWKFVADVEHKEE